MSRLRKGKLPVPDMPDRPSASNSNTDEPIKDVSRAKSDSIGAVVLRKTSKIFMVLFIAYCTVPFMLCVSYTVRHQLVFLNYLVNPFVNYSVPESRGISNTVNFYIQGESGRLGVWHVQAKDSLSISDGKPIVLYMHGNGYSRNAFHRIGVYKLLSSLGCHVVAFDYRGFGDSEGYPTEKGITEDGLTTYNWIKTNVKTSSIYIWGHSLGSGVAVSVAKELRQDARLTGIILDGAFNNMRDGSFHHPIARPWRFVPFFHEMLQEVVDLFQTDITIKDVTCPILHIHTREDHIISFTLGRKLYEAALEGRDEKQSIEFEELHGFGHNSLHKSEDLPPILRKFMRLKNDDES